MKLTERFSTRVANYVAYRPRYPEAVCDCLRRRCGWSESAVVADVGSGTGILSELLLRHGNRVYGVEPNREMREAGEQELRGSPEFHSVSGTAEATTLPGGSVDLVTAGQAFHWFDRAAAAVEFRRILRPGGWVVLIWNDRRRDGSPFAEAYERLLQEFSSDYEKVDHKNVTDAVLDGFFGGGYSRDVCENRQMFDLAGLEGRLLSSSYAPEAGQPQHAGMMQELRRIFEMRQVQGRVPFDYDTKVYCGRLD